MRLLLLEQTKQNRSVNTHLPCRNETVIVGTNQTEQVCEGVTNDQGMATTFLGLGRTADEGLYQSKESNGKQRKSRQANEKTPDQKRRVVQSPHQVHARLWPSRALGFVPPDPNVTRRDTPVPCIASIRAAAVSCFKLTPGMFK